MNVSWAPFQDILCTCQLCSVTIQQKQHMSPVVISLTCLGESQKGMKGGNTWWKYWPGRLGLPTSEHSHGAKQTLMEKLRPGGGRSGRPGLLWRWTIHHESFFPGFFFIRKIWAQMGESFPQTLGYHPLRIREFL